MEGRIPYSDYLYPKVSVIIPTFNEARALTITLKSLMEQAYPDLEVLVIDAGSRDRTSDVVASFLDERIKLFSSSEYLFYEMLNKGISLSTGEYLVFLAPGRYYLSTDSIKVAMDIALDRRLPSLVFGAALVRIGSREPFLYQNPFSIESLKLGRAPSSLASCFFIRPLFESLGKFDPRYRVQGDFDLFCRLALSRGGLVESTTKVLSDEDQRAESRGRLLLHFRETFSIIYKYFGVKALFRWFFVERDLRHLFSLWLQGVKRAFFGTVSGKD